MMRAGSRDGDADRSGQGQTPGKICLVCVHKKLTVKASESIKNRLLDQQGTAGRRKNRLCRQRAPWTSQIPEPIKARGPVGLKTVVVIVQDHGTSAVGVESFDLFD